MLEVEFFGGVRFLVEVDESVTQGCLSYVESHVHRVERHLHEEGHVFEADIFQPDLPVQRRTCCSRVGCGRVGEYHGKLCVFQFQVVQNGRFGSQLHSVRVQKEFPQVSFQLHAFNQVERVDSSLFNLYSVYFHLLLEQGEHLDLYGQFADVQNRVIVFCDFCVVDDKVKRK